MRKAFRTASQYDLINGGFRPQSTFDSYEPKTDSQTKAKATFQQIARQLVATAPKICSGENPFPNGRVIIVSGGIGTGKSHLMEATLNEIVACAPDLLDHVFLLKGPPLGYVIDYDISPYSFQFGHKPIIFIDDLFSNVESVDNLKRTDIRPLMRLISGAYEHRNIIVATTNFPFVGSLLPHFEQHDPVGRIMGRCHEIAKEIIIEGPDHRALIAQQKLAAGGNDEGGLLGLGDGP